MTLLSVASYPSALLNCCSFCRMTQVTPSNTVLVLSSLCLPMLVTSLIDMLQVVQQCTCNFSATITSPVYTAGHRHVWSPAPFHGHDPYFNVLNFSSSSVRLDVACTTKQIIVLIQKHIDCVSRPKAASLHGSIMTRSF